MMTAMVLVLWSVRSAQAFAPNLVRRQAATTRLFSSPSTATTVTTGVSRVSTLQTLISQHGVPGLPTDVPSWQPIPMDTSSQPELVSALVEHDQDSFPLHPYLIPIAHCPEKKHFIAAYRNPAVELENSRQQWPLVYTRANAPGFHLLAMQSEHLMHRLVAEQDAAGTASDELLDLYNNQDATGTSVTPYLSGAVQKLGYGVTKYCLLKAGPFPDLYQELCRSHKDESSALLAAEMISSKCPGFASPFLFYADVLVDPDVLAQPRLDESRDAARMCLRLPLPTLGVDYADWVRCAQLSQFENVDGTASALEKLLEFYDKIRSVENQAQQQPQPGDDAKTPEQIALEEAMELLDRTTLRPSEEQECDWNAVRPAVAAKLQAAGLSDMAAMVYTPKEEKHFE